MTFYKVRILQGVALTRQHKEKPIAEQKFAATLKDNAAGRNNHGFGYNNHRSDYIRFLITLQFCKNQKQ